MYSFVACLSHLTIDHATLSRRSKGGREGGGVAFHAAAVLPVRFISKVNDGAALENVLLSFGGGASVFLSFASEIVAAVGGGNGINSASVVRFLCAFLVQSSACISTKDGWVGGWMGSRAGL